MKVGYTYSTISKLPKELRPEDVGKQISVEGIVSRISEVLEYPFKVTFVCQTCGHEIVAEYKPWEKPTKPKKCEECNSKNIKIDPLKSFSRRYQLLRIQDPPEALTEGVPPTHVDGIVIDSLVGSLKLGARVRVTGVLTAASRNSSGNRGFVLKNVLEVTHVDIIGKESPGDSVTDQDIRRFHEEVQKKDFKQRIIQSMIPIRGYDSLKEGLLLAVLGGAETWLPDGTKLRRNIHVLIVDEQQKASHILSPIVEMMPRVLYVEGSTIQRSELVAKTVRDDLTMERVIQAGPLVLANEGVFILEDLDKLSKLDKESLAKVMEQEVAFLPKADVVGKFSVKTTVIAVAAPKSGVIDKSKSLASQLNVTLGLLNAFDLVYIMSNATSGEQAKNERLYSISPLWASRESYYDREFIRKFIAYARSLNPVLSV
ncbi:MAG TPA: minichromosome maintenance protein MCM, partial [Thermococcus litoralis]|nr:minichromosome maintenance protein MCM [Thermococcus litoralis]